jgi:integrase
VRLHLPRSPDASVQELERSHPRRRSCCSKDLISRLEASDQAGELVAARLTLNQYLDRWLELAARLKLRAKSFADYEALLGRHIRPSLGQRGLSSLAPLDFQSIYHRMRASGLSPRTVRYTHSVLHAALEQAVAGG